MPPVAVKRGGPAPAAGAKPGGRRTSLALDRAKSVNSETSATEEVNETKKALEEAPADSYLALTPPLVESVKNAIEWGRWADVKYIIRRRMSIDLPVSHHKLVGPNKQVFYDANEEDKSVRSSILCQYYLDMIYHGLEVGFQTEPYIAFVSIIRETHEAYIDQVERSGGHANIPLLLDIFSYYLLRYTKGGRALRRAPLSDQGFHGTIPPSRGTEVIHEDAELTLTQAPVHDDRPQYLLPYEAEKVVHYFTQTYAQHARLITYVFCRPQQVNLDKRQAPLDTAFPVLKPLQDAIPEEIYEEWLMKEAERKMNELLAMQAAMEEQERIAASKAKADELMAKAKEAEAAFLQEYQAAHAALLADWEHNAPTHLAVNKDALFSPTTVLAHAMTHPATSGPPPAVQRRTSMGQGSLPPISYSRRGSLAPVKTQGPANAFTSLLAQTAPAYVASLGKDLESRIEETVHHLLDRAHQAQSLIQLREEKKKEIQALYAVANQAVARAQALVEKKDARVEGKVKSKEEKRKK